MDVEPNGSHAAGPSNPSPFADIALSVDAYTLDAATGKRRLKQIEPDGTLTYDSEKTPRDKRTEEVGRLWYEYPNWMLDLREEDLRAADPTTTYGGDGGVKAEAEETKPERGEQGTLMRPEDMEALRSEVFADLNTARNELWYILELAKTLAASANISSDPPPEPVPAAPARKGKAQPPKPAPAAGAAPMIPGAKTDEVPPVLPAGTYSTVPAAAPERPAAEVAHELELALAAKATALDDCAALIDAAVDELRLMNDASATWAADIRALRSGSSGRGQWAVIPRPDYGHTGETAKDVVIPYALDEGPTSLYSRSLAGFDLDPRKASNIVFGARTYLRMRVLLRSGGSGSPQMSSQTYDATQEHTDSSPAEISAALEAAQMEAVDEDLFGQLRVEAGRLDSALIEPQSISLRIGKDRLTFQLYDSRTTPTPDVPFSPTCDALLVGARLGLLHKYERRKQNLIEGLASTASNVPPHQLPTNTVLLPLVNVLQYAAVCAGVRPVLESLRQMLVAAGRGAALVERYATVDNPETTVAFLAARTKVDVLGAVFTLEVEGCHGMSVTVTAPAGLNVTTARATFPVRDIDALPGLAADAIACQLSAHAFDTVRAAAGDDRGVFFDELDGVVVAGALGPLQFSIPAPYTSLHAAVDYGIAPYDSANATQSLDEWLQDLGRAVPAVSEQDHEGGNENDEAS